MAPQRLAILLLKLSKRIETILGMLLSNSQTFIMIVMQVVMQFLVELHSHAQKLFFFSVKTWVILCRPSCDLNFSTHSFAFIIRQMPFIAQLQ